MHSSISNSEPGDNTAVAVMQRAIITLLICAVAFVSLLELGTRAFVYRISKNLSRIHQEELAAVQTRGGQGGAQQILLVGNSLLLNDVNIGELKRHLSPGQDIRQFAIQATTYYDWYYGIRRLLAKGSSPDLIVVCFEPRHILLSGIRSEIFAYYLMAREDLFDVRQTLKSTGSETFDLFLANQSIFYALRKELRQVLLQRLLPELPHLTAMIVRAPKPLPNPEALRTIGKERLLAIQESIGVTKSQIALLLMPPVQTDSLEAVKIVGREIGLPVLVPVDHDSITDGDYQADGYHLNEQGRDKFTKALAPLLAEMKKRL